MSDVSQYFGEKGAFAEACDLYQRRYSLPFPEDVLKRANMCDTGRLAFTLGYSFAVVLSKREMSITDKDLNQVARNKINSADPAYFVQGFRFYKE